MRWSNRRTKTRNSMERWYRSSFWKLSMSVSTGVRGGCVTPVNGSDHDHGVVPVHVHGHGHGVDHVDGHDHVDDRCPSTIARSAACPISVARAAHSLWIQGH